jgi:hypothetical protein
VGDAGLRAPSLLEDVVESDVVESDVWRSAASRTV